MITLGQKIWVDPGRYNSHKELYEAIVIKVGRKYFEIDDGETGRKYDIESLQEVNASNYRSCAYLSKDVFLEKKEYESLTSEIKKAFSGWGKLPYTLEQLREIKKIISL